MPGSAVYSTMPSSRPSTASADEATSSALSAPTTVTTKSNRTRVSTTCRELDSGCLPERASAAPTSAPSGNATSPMPDTTGLPSFVSRRSDGSPGIRMRPQHCGALHGPQGPMPDSTSGYRALTYRHRSGCYRSLGAGTRPQEALADQKSEWTLGAGTGSPTCSVPPGCGAGNETDDRSTHGVAASKKAWPPPPMSSLTRKPSGVSK